MTVTIEHEKSTWDVFAFQHTSPSIKRHFALCKEPAVLTLMEPPYHIIACNSAWQEQCGYKGSEAIGQTPKLLQGNMTDQIAANKFATDCMEIGQGRATLINYKKDGTSFAHKLRALKLEGRYFLTEGVALPPPPEIWKKLAQHQTNRRNAAEQLIAIQSALMLLYFFAFSNYAHEPPLLAAGFSTTAAVWVKAASAPGAILGSEAIALATCFLFAVFVAALSALHTRSRHKHVSASSTEAAVGFAILVAIACVTAEAPPVVFTALAGLACLATEDSSSGGEQPARRARRRLPMDPSDDGFSETICATAACLCLVFYYKA